MSPLVRLERFHLPPTVALRLDGRLRARVPRCPARSRAVDGRVRDRRCPRAEGGGGYPREAGPVCRGPPASWGLCWELLSQRARVASRTATRPWPARLDGVGAAVHWPRAARAPLPPARRH